MKSNTKYICAIITIIILLISILTPFAIIANQPPAQTPITPIETPTETSVTPSTETSPTTPVTPTETPTTK